MSTIAENIAAIRARIDAAARLSGRTGADITLVAATKMNDAARVREAVAAGIDACGENRVQEMTEKLAEGAHGARKSLLRLGPCLQHTRLVHGRGQLHRTDGRHADHHTDRQKG